MIGAGQLGCRHFESLKCIKVAIEIFVVDVSAEALRGARNTAELLQDNELIKNIYFLTSYDDLPKHIDILIIATNANVRYGILNEVSKDRVIKYSILEKVLFQSEYDFFQAKELIAKCNIKTWVNCPRRLYTYYQYIKNELSANSGQAPVYGVLSGSDWSMGSNAIHYIDGFAFLVQCDEYVIDVSGLDKSVLKSKRAGYLEITGIMIARFANGSVLTLSSQQNSSERVHFTIVKGGVTICLNETDNFMRVYDTELDLIKSANEKTFKIPYQSELTSVVVEDILLTSNCGLTTFEESVTLHLPLINSLQLFFKNNYDHELQYCPIT